jgi:signal transduction histidine kinase
MQKRRKSPGGSKSPKGPATPDAPRAPLVVTLDGQGQLIDMVGSPAAFGALEREDIVRLLLDLTVGSDGPAEVLQAVELVDGHFVDIHVVTEDELRHFVLRDASELIRSLQRNQQLSNDAALQQASYQRHPGRAVAARKSAGLFATLVGEMRGPLARLSGHIGTLSRRCRNDPAALRSIAMLRHAALQLDALSSNGLIAMGEYSTEVIGNGLVDLHRLAGFLQDLFSLHAEGLGLGLTIRVPEAQATIELDDRALRQLLINLITHALGDVEQGRLELTMSVGARYLEVELDAEPEGFRPELFGPLITTNELLHSNRAGSLVLAVSQQILRRMDATIELVPRTGGGCVIWFRLPVRPHSTPDGSVA